MKINTSVWAPASLLLHPHLPPSAKLLWMVLFLHSQSGPVRPAILQARSTLARATVRWALRRLAQEGWCRLDPGNLATATNPDISGPRAAVPAVLLADPRVGIRGKVLYGILQRMPRFQCPRGQRPQGPCTYVGLADLARASINAVKRGVRDLVQAGWMETAQVNQLAPIRCMLRNPPAERAEAELAATKRRLAKEGPFGQTLMREYLSILSSSQRFQDEAAPAFLVNPWTKEQLRPDRYYADGVIFEYNGPQHDGPTEQFNTTAEELALQWARDSLKEGLARRAGVAVVVVRAEDLSLDGMRQKIGTLLPLRDLTGYELAIKHLEWRSAPYRQKAASGGTWLPATL